MDFVVNGRPLSLTAEEVERRLHGVTPEPIQTHGVRIDATIYPVKQALSLATGLPRDDFTSQTARRLFSRLGLELIGTAPARSTTMTAPRGKEPADPRGWPWEGKVQTVFAGWLARNGWMVTGMADTSTKAHGVDILGQKGNRLLGAEVKGWPSKGYADPRRADEVKRTQPTSQAGHWFSQALMKAIMLLDSHPDHESLMVVPDYPRYRDLAARTARGRMAADVHVVFVQPSGKAMSDTWSP
jgi:hypothetical protein